MATKIKLQRLGKLREPHYRIVVADARTKRDGRYIEAIGQYHPKSNPSVMSVDADRAAYWLRVGAQPTETVVRILSVTGDWQKFKGLPAPPAMLVAPPKAVKSEVFAAAAKVAAGIEDKPATTARKAAPKKAAKPAAETPAPEVAAVEAPASEVVDATEAPEAAAEQVPATDEAKAE